MKKKSGLGLGLGSLIPKAITKSVVQAGKDNIFYIEIHKIQPNPNQPRRDMEESSLKELASSIKRFGVLQPIIVSKIERETPKGLEVGYEIIAGERRWRAAQLAKITQIPVIIKDNLDHDRAKLEVALIENIQRENLNPMEEARAYERLHTDFGLTHQEVSERVGKSRGLVTNTMRLLSLPDDMQNAVAGGQLSRTHGRNLASYNDNPKHQKWLYGQILKGNLSVSDLEKMRRDYYERKIYVGVPVRRFDEFQDNLSKKFGSPVSIRNGAKGSSVTFRAENTEELEKILYLLLG